MQASYLVLACLLLAGTVHVHGRELEQAAGATCKSVGALKIVVKDGFCRGWAKTSCQAHGQADVQIGVAIDHLFKQGVCEIATLRKAASAIAQAYARVHTQALSNVVCKGKGFGCGFTLSSGSAFATAYAKTIVKVVTGIISKDKTLSALCIADLEALATGLAKASSKSFASACVRGSGSARRFESNLVEATVKLVTFAFVKATAGFCQTEEALKAKSSSLCFIDGGAGSVGGAVPPTGQSPRSSQSTTGGGSTRGDSDGNVFAKKLKACHDSVTVGCCYVPGHPCPGLSKSFAAAPGVNILFSGGKPVCSCH